MSVLPLQTYCLPNPNHSYPAASYLGQSAFVDIDFDGEIDHLIPACLDEHLPNKNFFCETSAILRYNVVSQAWTNILLPSLDNAGSNFGSSFQRTLSFANRKVYEDIELPWMLRVADMNYDGYPDLVTVVYDATHKRHMAAILTNVDHKGQRMFALTWLSVDKLIEPVLMVSLFDPYNVGRLSMLITYEKHGGGHPDETRVQTMICDYYVDILDRNYYNFLKVHVTGGQCSQRYDRECPNEQKSAVGTNPASVMVCYAGIGSHRGCAPQMPQTTHFALPLPYVIFGLGEVISEINELEVCVANGTVRQWDEMIPGSSLVVSTYTPDNPDRWQLDVYINMSIYGVILFLAILVFIFILSFAIYIFHLFERHEDRKDIKVFQSQYLNFKNNRPR